MKHAQKAIKKNPGAQRVKEQARRLTDYLGTQRIALSRTQSLEAVSNAVYGKPWNVVRSLEDTDSAPDSTGKVAGRHDPESGCTLVLKPGAAALTVDQLMQITSGGRYYLDVATPLGIWELIGGDAETVMDTLSECITGSASGLQDITFSRYDSGAEQLSYQDDQAIYVRVVAEWAADSLGDELDGYLAVSFAWVYPDEDGDHVPATVNLKTGEILLHEAVPSDIANDMVRTRLEDDDRIEVVDAYFDTKDQVWRVRAAELKELQNW